MDPFSYFRNFQVGEVLFHLPRSYSQMIGVSKTWWSVFIGVIWWRHRSHTRIDPSTGDPDLYLSRSSPQANSIESWAIQSSWASWHEGIFWVCVFFPFLFQTFGEFLKINLRDFFWGIKAMMHMFFLYFFFQKTDHYLGDGFNLYLLFLNFNIETWKRCLFWRKFSKQIETTSSLSDLHSLKV